MIFENHLPYTVDADIRSHFEIDPASQDFWTNAKNELNYSKIMILPAITDTFCLDRIMTWTSDMAKVTTYVDVCPRRLAYLGQP